MSNNTVNHLGPNDESATVQTVSDDFIERLVAGQLLSRMTELEAELAAERAANGRLRAEVSRMDCTCLPYAEPHDGMCSRCMALRGPS